MSRCVDTADRVHPQKLNNVFLIMQQCKIETRGVGGENNYRMPHLNKSKLIKKVVFPSC